MVNKSKVTVENIFILYYIEIKDSHGLNRAEKYLF